MSVELINLPIFKGLMADELDKLLSQIVYQRKSYQKGAMVVMQGEACNRLLILTEGRVKNEMSGPTGKSLKIEDMTAPAILAPAFLFGKKNVFPVNVIAEENASFIVIPREQLLKLFQLCERILQNFLSMISSRAQFLSEKLRFHSFKALKAKLAFYLINEAGKNKSFKLRHSQNELAELFGVARPSIGRAFMQLQEDGIVTINYKQVEIIQMEQLALACNE